jgi:TetR/AcrR family transcriptional regulator, tetracycline repressor protein
MGRSRGTPLDRREIVRAALALIRRDGLEALSMRRLARELGVEAMSLYHHVRSKDDLLDACIAEVSASLDLGGMERPGPWRDRLKAGFTAYRGLAHEHPELFALVGHRPVQDLEVLRPIEVALGVFADAGFTPAEGMRAFRIVNSFVYGYALSELTGLAVQTASDAAAAGDLSAFPNLIRAIPIARDADRDVEFEHGLDTILDGIASWQAAGPPLSSGA